MVRFTINEDQHTIESFDVNSTLLSYLRENGITDVKQMCEEGGCGACSLVEIGKMNKQTEARAVSACLIPLAQVNNRSFITPAKISTTKRGKEICNIFATNFASQCGYCTPGIVAAVASCSNERERETVLDGHICRCTGYRPIIQAVRKAPFIDVEDLAELCASCPSREENCHQNCSAIPLSDGSIWHQPSSISEVMELKKLPNTKIISGNTSKYAEKHYRELKHNYDNIIDVSRVEELNIIELIGSKITIGASVSIQDFTDVLKSIDSKNTRKIVKAFEFIGSESVRHQGSVGGSLYLQRNNKEFCSDIAVILGALDVRLMIRRKHSLESLSLDEFMVSQDDLLVYAELEIPDSVNLTVGKVTPRPTMSVGDITYAFCSNSVDNTGRYYFNIGDGLTSIPPPETFDKIGFNSRILSVDNILVKCQLLKHFLEICNEPIDPLNYDPVEYFLDDAGQPDSAKNIPQQHAVHLAAGTASFPSDTPPGKGQLHVAFVKATEVGNIENIYYDNCKDDKDFVCCITAGDIASAGFTNNFHQAGSGEGDESIPEEIICSKSVLYINQPVAIIVARSRSAAYRLRQLVDVQYSDWCDGTLTKPTSSLDEAVERKDFFPNPNYEDEFGRREKGDVDSVLSRSDLFVVQDEFDMPGQYHNYLETQYACVTLADTNIDIDIGSQYLDKVQRSVAYALGIPHASISVKCRRTGGSFGGKATRSAWFAVAAAFAAKFTNRSCSIHLSMEDCIQIIGGRSIFRIKYKAAFEKSGKCIGVDMQIYSDTGACCNDNLFTSMLIASHGDGCYDIPNHRYDIKFVRTARPAATWLRAPGMLQAVFAIERVIDHGCRMFKFDQFEGRKINFAGPGSFSMIGNPEKTNRIEITFDKLREKSHYDELVAEVEHFNSVNKWKKKGISIQSMRYPYGVDFHTSSVMISVLKMDGSVQATVGGIDIGQGQHTRCAQIIANNLGCDISRVVTKPSSTDVNSNTGPTGGTVTTHVMLLLLDRAADNLKRRMIKEAKRQKKSNLPWDDLVKVCGNIDLHERNQGNFTGDGSSYAVAGASLAVVELDCLTGEHVIERMELVYDAGVMINVGIELGQIEGGLVMSLGWLKTECLSWNESSGSEQHGTWDYIVPMHKDLPKIFKIHLETDAPEFENGPLTGKKMNYPMSSKQAGEAAMCLGLSPTSALQNAIEAFQKKSKYVTLPATSRNVFAELQLSADNVIID